MNDNPSRLTQKVRTYINSLPKELFKKASTVAPDADWRDDMLPFDLYEDIPRYIKLVADQINKSFHFGIYDGCAILMRRLIEMLLILTFKNFNVEGEILDSNADYLHLSQIIIKAESSRVIHLSRNAKEYLKLFRDKGDLSAHNPFYHALRQDLELVQHKFRLLVEELFDKAGVIK
jgi:hypothetical protein